MGLLSSLARMRIGPIVGGLDPNARQPVFYSAVQEVLRQSKPEAKTGKDWLEMFIEPERVVRSAKRDPATNKPMLGDDGQPIVEERIVPERIKIPDVRAQEMKWSGLADLLKAEPDRQFTRDDLLNHMTAAKKKYDPHEVYMSHSGQSEEDWLAEHEDSILSAVDDNMWEDFRHNAEMPSYDIENVGPRTSREVLRDIELVKAGMHERSGNPRDSLRPWEDRLFNLNKELELALARDMRDPNTVDMFSGEVGGGALNDTPQYIANISGGFDDIDETLPDKFDSHTAAEDAAEEWIRDYRSGGGEGWRSWFEQDGVRDEHYQQVLDDFRENNARERGTKYDGEVGNAAYTDGGKNYEELLFTLPQFDQEYSTHWSDWVDEPVIAHVRYDERPAPGKFAPEQLPTVERIKAALAKHKELQQEIDRRVIAMQDAGVDDDVIKVDPSLQELVKERDALRADAFQPLPTPPRENRALAIQEMQSDWHQDGRNEGYAREVPESERIDAQYNKSVADEEARNAKEAILDYGISLPSGVRRAVLQGRMADHFLDEATRYFDTGELPARANPSSRIRQNAEYESWANHNLLSALLDQDANSLPGLSNLVRRHNEANLKRIEAERAWTNAQGGGVPDAPFANNVWAEVALKRMLRKAADENFDELAWSTNIQNGRHLGNRDWDGKEFYDKVLVNMGNKIGRKAGVSVGSRQDSRGIDWRTMEMTPEFVEFLKKGLPLFMWPLFAGGAASVGGLLSRRRQSSEA